MTAKTGSTGELIAVERCKIENNKELDDKMRMFADLIIEKILSEENKKPKKLFNKFI